MLCGHANANLTRCCRQVLVCRPFPIDGSTSSRQPLATLHSGLCSVHARALSLRYEKSEWPAFIGQQVLNPTALRSPVLCSLTSRLGSPSLLNPTSPVNAAACLQRLRRGHTGALQSLVAQQAGKSAPDSRRLLFVGNLPWVLDSYGLRKLFEPFGEVLNAQIAHDDQNDRSMGYGHVLFTSQKSAENAIRDMDRRDIGGRSINVHFVRKHARVTAADAFDFEDYGRGGGGRGGRGGYVNAREMRFNPGASGGSRYATPVSQEKLAYQYARDFMDSDFLAKLQDPRLKLDEDDFLDYPVVHNDDEFEWETYSLTWDRWDPKEEVLEL